MSSILSNIEGRLKRTLASIERRLSGEPEEVFREIPPRQTVPARTIRQPPRVTVATPVRSESYPSTSLDDRVFGYIEAHNGEISLSKTAADLSISFTELQEVITKLRASGRLGLESGQLSPSIASPMALSQRICVRCSSLIDFGARYCTNCGAEQS